MIAREPAAYRGIKAKRRAMAMLAALRRNRAGVTAIEYGLIVGAIAVAIIATVIALGGDIANLFSSAGSAMSSASSSGTY
jgi:pilus assembly protein Flp/PilA